jgi:hypothetical protein
MSPSGFYLQQTGQKGDQLVGLASTLSNGPGGRPGVVFAPVGTSTRLRGLYAVARPAGAAFLDPSGYLIDRPASAQRARHYPWLDISAGRPASRAEWQAWMQASIEHQTSKDGLLGEAAAPEIVVSPSPYLRAAAPHAELYSLVDAWSALSAETARSLWLSLTIDREYVREEAHLTRLADAIVDAKASGLILRIFQADLAPVGDRRTLDGMREIVRACAGSGIPVFLPNAGWTGWLAMAWGADGFSGGLPKSSWFDRWPTPMNPPPQEHKIFEVAVLRHVTWTTQQSLAGQPNYAACQCASCQAMGVVFDPDDASLHQIRAAQELGSDLVGRSLAERADVVRDRLDAAIAFRDGLSVVLRDRVAAGFLDTWRSLV